MKKILFTVLGLVILAGTYWYISGSGIFSRPKVILTPEVLQIQKQGFLRIGTDATYFPMEHLDEDQNIVGFDIDLAREIGKAFNVPLKIKNISFDDIFKELKSGQIDMIISSVTINSERSKTMSFSTPYFNAGQVIVTLQNNSAIANLASLKGKKIGVQIGTTSENEAVKLTAPELVSHLADYDLATTKLLSGQIEAMIMDYPAAVGKVKHNPGLKIVGIPFTDEYYGVVVSKANAGLLTTVNSLIERLKDSGELKKIENRWLK